MPGEAGDAGGADVAGFTFEQRKIDGSALGRNGKGVLTDDLPHGPTPTLAPLSITDAARSGWHTDDEVFPPAPVPGAVGGSRRGAMQRGDEELILFTLYDDTAMRHVQANRLNDRDELERLRRTLVARRPATAGPAARTGRGRVARRDRGESGNAGRR